MTNKKLNIGFIKFGLKTYFNKSGSGQGGNHELVDVFDIFENRGHNCQMISFNDKYETIKDLSKLDYIFAFNGFLPNTLDTKMVMLQKTVEMYKKINSCEVPWVYFWTDARYDIRKIDVVRQPNLILSQEKEFYGGLETLICYKKQIKEAEKTNKLGILMNETEPKRSKKVQNALSWLDYGEIKGNWKKQTKFNTGELKEDEVSDYLSKTKYSYNLATNPKWLSQKFYEMALNKVVCFYTDYDEDEILLKKDNFLKVRDEIELQEKIELLEQDPITYNKLVNEISNYIALEFKNGDYIYNSITSKLCSLEKTL